MNAGDIVKKMGFSARKQGGVHTLRAEKENFAQTCARLAGELQLQPSLFFVTDERAHKKGFGLHAVFSHDASHEWIMVESAVSESDPRYPSLTPTLLAAQWYERYAMDMFGIVAEGHPDPRRLAHHENMPRGVYPLRKDFEWNTVLPRADEPYPMHHVEGGGIYEIPVGPIHAGIIEPGHFRFNVAGERIITLEGKLFFTHKGVEKLLEGKTPEEAMPFIERVSTDMSASHALAFCQAVEECGETPAPARAAYARALIGELERVTMHIHDISNMAGMGTGYTIMAAQGFRIKEKMVRLSDRLFGNRFWRGGIVPGGVARDFDAGELSRIGDTVEEVCREMEQLVDIGRHSDGLRERLETTGVLSRQAALAYGAVGIAARASGIDRDTRRDHPYAAFGDIPPEIITLTDGDVYARYKMRYKEMAVSRALIKTFIERMPAGPVRVECRASDGTGIGAVESWRGELLNVVYMRKGKIERCVVRDPSFCNWPLFGEIGPGNIVPDFPLCNKSLDLSYSGTDL